MQSGPMLRCFSNVSCAAVALLGRARRHGTFRVGMGARAPVRATIPPGVSLAAVRRYGAIEVAEDFSWRVTHITHLCDTFNRRVFCPVWYPGNCSEMIVCNELRFIPGSDGIQTGLRKDREETRAACASFCALAVSILDFAQNFEVKEKPPTCS